MSSTSVGFQWGTKINEKSIRCNKSEIRKIKNVNKKRKYPEGRKVEKPELREQIINKRAKIPIIKGEVLPIPRVIESLDHKATSNLLNDLLTIHPELHETIMKIKPKIPLEASIKVIFNKFTMIKENLPYKGDLQNDYSYLRIKPFLNEFLNCLSDFILSYLPPIQDDLADSLNFIVYSTNLVLELPKFDNDEFKYIRAKCFEQFSNTWLIILNNIYSSGSGSGTDNDHNENDENLYNFIKIINDFNLKQKLQEINEKCENQFDKVIEFISNKFEKYNSNDLNDFITIDYSNYSLTANTTT